MTPVRFTGLALAAIIGLGLLLRLPSPYLYLEYDEVISILFARQSLGAMVQATAADIMPPLYYGLLHGWLQLLAPMVTAERELLLARSLSLLCSVLAIPVFYLLARRVADTVDALAATALLALSPFHAFYGHFTRMYALLELVGLLAALCFVCWLQENRRRDLLLFTVGRGRFVLRPLARFPPGALARHPVPARAAPTGPVPSGRGYGSWRRPMLRCWWPLRRGSSTSPARSSRWRAPSGFLLQGW